MQEARSKACSYISVPWPAWWNIIDQEMVTYTSRFSWLLRSFCTGASERWANQDIRNYIVYFMVWQAWIINKKACTASVNSFLQPLIFVWCREYNLPSFSTCYQQYKVQEIHHIECTIYNLVNFIPAFFFYFDNYIKYLPVFHKTHFKPTFHNERGGHSLLPSFVDGHTLVRAGLCGRDLMQGQGRRAGRLLLDNLDRVCLILFHLLSIVTPVNLVTQLQGQGQSKMEFDLWWGQGCDFRKPYAGKKSHCFVTPVHLVTVTSEVRN